MSEIQRPSDYERSDADHRLIGALAAGAAVFLATVPFVLLAAYPGADRLGQLPANSLQPPEPRLQVQPRADLQRQRADEDRRLATFGWVDREGRIARLPIEDAMRLLAARGLPGWPPPQQTPPR